MVKAVNRNRVVFFFINIYRHKTPLPSEGGGVPSPFLRSEPFCIAVYKEKTIGDICVEETLTYIDFL